MRGTVAPWTPPPRRFQGHPICRAGQLHLHNMRSGTFYREPDSNTVPMRRQSEASTTDTRAAVRTPLDSEVPPLHPMQYRTRTGAAVHSLPDEDISWGVVV